MFFVAERLVNVDVRMGDMRLSPRFTVLTLASVVPLVCAYVGAWEATNRYGITDDDFANLYRIHGMSTNPSAVDCVVSRKLWW